MRHKHGPTFFTCNYKLLRESFQIQSSGIGTFRIFPVFLNNLIGSMRLLQLFTTRNGSAVSTSLVIVIFTAVLVVYFINIIIFCISFNLIMNIKIPFPLLLPSSLLSCFSGSFHFCVR